MQIDRDKILQAAQSFVQKKRYDRALAEYQKIIAHDPEDVRTLLKIGDVQSKMEAWADAVATYEKVGRYYAAKGSALKAVAVFKQILEIVHKHLPAFADRYDYVPLRLAELYVQLGLVSDALNTYDQVATKLQRAGREDEAIAVFQKLVELDKTNPLPHLRLAEAYSRAKDIDGATRHFATAAEILMRLHRRDEALKVFERLLHHNKNEPRFARQAAELYLERGAANDGMLALAKLQICFQADPKNLDTLVLLARAFVAIGQPAKAIEVEKELARIAKDQNNLRAYRETVERLAKAVPNDDGVRKLLASMPPSSEIADPVPAPSSVPVVSADPEPVLSGSSRPATAAAAGSSRAPAIEAVSEPPIPLTDGELEELSYEDIEAEPPGNAAPLLLSRPISAPASSTRPTAAAASSRPPQSQRKVQQPQQKLQAPASEPPQLDVRESLLDPAEVAAASGDPLADPRRILTEVESFERLGLVDQAIERLVAGIEHAPRSIALRVKLRDLLILAGDHPNAAEQMIAVAVLAYESEDLATAIQQLYSAMQVVPGHPTAAQLLTNLGYDPNASPYAGADFVPPPSEPHSALPSYDIEEIGATEALAASPRSRSLRDSYAPLSPAADGAPLPSFPMEDDEPAAAAAAQAPGRPARVGGAETIEDALEEAEFFLSRGLYDDARAIVQEQLGRAPNHLLLIERLREIDAAKAAHLESGTRARPARSSSTPAPGTRNFDIAASLEALDALDAGPQSEPIGKQVDVEEVFTQFKAGVRAEVAETDSATHYDLGLAYREMGLLRDALEEFRIAARDPKRACICLSMMGMIHRGQGDDAAAIEAFSQGLRVEQRTVEQELGLLYELGDVYATKGDVANAIAYFKKVAHRNPSYGDPRGKVSARLEALTQVHKRPARPKPQHAEADDFDQAFDALIERRK